MKKLLFLPLLISACLPPPPPAKDNRAYELTKEEVAYFAGCVDMGNKFKIKDILIICADLNTDFIKRHRREWE